jgi:hypothetical protein
MGKVLSTITHAPRLRALHHALPPTRDTAHLLASRIRRQSPLFLLHLRLASCISMVTRREDGPLLATMSFLVVGVLNSMSPSLKKIDLRSLPAHRVLF